MRILIGCEYSGRVREAFRALGHDAWSCDLLPAEDDSPHHIKGDVLQAANGGGGISGSFTRHALIWPCLGPVISRKSARMGGNRRPWSFSWQSPA